MSNKKFGVYWSSSENDSNNAWNVNVNSGDHTWNNNNRTNKNRVRLVRAQ